MQNSMLHRHHPVSTAVEGALISTRTLVVVAVIAVLLVVAYYAGRLGNRAIP